MKLNEIVLLENQTQERYVTEQELRELFKKYKFVTYNWSMEYDHECEIAMLSDIPSTVSAAKIKQLAAAVTGPDEYTAGRLAYSLEDIKDWVGLTEGFDPGTYAYKLPQDQQDGMHHIYVMPFTVWANAYVAFERQLASGGDDFEEDQ